MEFGNSGIHGTLTDYPFLIVENKDTGNVVRICIYYAYSQDTGKELNAEAINLNYLLINTALKNIGQQELANVIITIKNKVNSSNNDDVPVKGIEYGTMNGSKNSYGNLKGLYLMFGTTMNSLYEEIEDVEQQEEVNDDKSSTNKQEDSNNSTSEDKQTSNSNNQNTNNNLDNNDDYIEDNVQDEEDDKLIGISHKELENKTEQELKDLLTSKGLVPKVVSKTEEIAYSDDLANTTKSTVELELGNEGNNCYYKGETVEIINTYYKPISWTANLFYNVNNASFNVFGKTCYVDPMYADNYYGVFCFLEDPTKLNSFDVAHGRGDRGAKLYIDNEYQGCDKGYYEYTFDNVETITLKIVAPYVYEYDQDGKNCSLLGTDVVVYEKELNVKELYKNMEGHIVELKIK